MSDTFQKLALVPEGEHIVRLDHGEKHWYMNKRPDLHLFFWMENSLDYDGVILPGYFQVREWINEKTFRAGPKSKYFRMYQACFGPVDSDIFRTDDFRGIDLRALVKNIKRDSTKEALAPVNHYSKVDRILGKADED